MKKSVFFLFIFPVLKEKSETLKVVLLKSTGVKMSRGHLFLDPYLLQM